MKATNKDGQRNKALVQKVLKLRDEKHLSWTKIKLALREGKTGIVVSGSTVRRMYDEGHGRKGAHYDSRPLTGGRYHNDQKTEVAKKIEAPKAAVTKKVTSGASSKPRTVVQKTSAKATAGKARKVTKATQPADSDSTERPAAKVG